MWCKILRSKLEPCGSHEYVVAEVDDGEQVVGNPISAENLFETAAPIFADDATDPEVDEPIPFVPIAIGTLVFCHWGPPDNGLRTLNPWADLSDGNIAPREARPLYFHVKTPLTGPGASE